MTMTTMSYAEDWYDRCDAMGKLANDIMTARQKGVPIEGMIEALQKILEKENQSYILGMIRDAYRYPLVHSQENKYRIILKFESQWYIDCVTIATQ